MPDRELVARVRELAIVESNATADLVAHLAELDERKLYRDEGCSSIFAYCVEVLHLSEHAAYNRIEAARAAQRFPLVLERLEAGAVHLTAVRLLRPHLTGENHRMLLDAAHHRSRREVEEIIARIQPKPDVPAMVRRLPLKEAAVQVDGAGELSLMPAASPDSTPQPGPVVTVPAVAHAPAPAPPAIIAPLAPERYRIQFTASAAAHDMLRHAQELLRHQLPDGDPAAIFEMALAALLKELERRKFAAVERPVGRDRAPVTSSTPGTTRHVPASVKRDVRSRDENRCVFVTPEGRRCSARGWLEFHHIQPYARGGRATADNIALLCARTMAMRRSCISGGKSRPPASGRRALRALGATRSGTS